MSSETVESLAARVDGRVVGDGELRIRGVADLGSAGPTDLGFVRDAAYLNAAASTRAGALLVAEVLEVPAAQIVVADVATAFARIASVFHGPRRAREHRVHPTAFVDPSATLAAPVEVGPQVSIGAGAAVGAGTVLAAGVVLEDGVQVGEECEIHPGVVICSQCRLGDRVIVQAGAVVGSDGFGYARDGAAWVKVPQVGDVLIEDDVEIGANCTVDRGTLGSTRIGRGVKIDNLCHIGHNCEIGGDTAIAALAVFGGSTRIGERCTIAGHVASKGHLRICDDVRVGGNSGVIRDITEPGDYMGYPVMEKQKWVRTLFAFERLGEMQARLRDMLRRRGDADGS